MADISEQGHLCEITTDHDFDRIVARKVFVGAHDRMRIEQWSTIWIQERIKADKAADPTFDAYGYTVETYEVEVRSDY